MIDTIKLKEKILDLAIRGKLVPQDPSDEPASVLLEKIKKEKLQMVKDGKLKQKDIKDDSIIFVGDDNLHYEKFADGSVKCIENEIPFEIPKSWAWCRLNAIAAAQPNSFVDGPFGSNLKTEHYTIKKEVRIIQLNNIGNFEWKNVGIKYTTFQHAEELKRCLTFPNDIVIAKMMPAGRAILVPNLENIYVISSDCVRLRVSDNICSKYIMYAINSCVVNTQIQGSVHGIGRSRTSLGKCKTLLVPIPPYKEQKLICDSIEENFNFLKVIEISKIKLDTTINNLKSKILDLAIRGKLVPQDPNDEPADVLLERIRKEKEELIKQGKIKRDKKESIIFKGDDNSYYEQFKNITENIGEEIPFNVPKSWVWARLGSYAQKITDYVASGSFASIKENVPVLKNKDYAIMVKTADFSNHFTQNLTYTTEHGYNYLENSNLFGGELILSNIGSIGKVFIVPELNQKMTLAPNTIMIKLVNDEYRDFVYNFLLSPWGYSQLLKISGGTGIAKFNKTDLKTLLLPVPPFNEQIRIIKQIKSLFNLLFEIEIFLK